MISSSTHTPAERGQAPDSVGEKYMACEEYLTAMREAWCPTKPRTRPFKCKCRQHRVLRRLPDNAFKNVVLTL